MYDFRPLFAALILPLSITGTATMAQDFFNGGVRVSDGSNPIADLFVFDTTVLDGQACIGNQCDLSETFSLDELVKLKWGTTSILFDDTSSATFPSRDWRLLVNDPVAVSSGGQERFSVEDVTSGRIPFTIEGGAPTNSMWISSAGNVGIGTFLPQSNLTLQGDSATSTNDIRFIQPGVFGGPEKTYLVGSTVSSFRISTADTTGSPFLIRNGAPSGAIWLLNDEMQVNAGEVNYDFHLLADAVSSGAQTLIFGDASTGNMGIGTNTPEERLHVRTTAASTDAFALFDAAGSGSDAAFRLRQSGSVPTTWEFRNQQSSGRLNVGIAGGNTPFKIDDAANNNLMRLGVNGGGDIVSITGRLLVNNTQLNVPDYVFEDDYALLPLREVSAFIDTHNHLPDVPSAAEIAQDGVDMTQMQMILLQKVEELTLYTLQQEDVIAQQREIVSTLHTRLARQNKRLDQMTGLLHHLAHDATD